MPQKSDKPRIAYVLKRFPRFSETFILNELLAHEAAGAEVHVFSLRRPPDEPRHKRLADLCAEVTYLEGLSGEGCLAVAGDEVLFPGKTVAQVARLRTQAKVVSLALQGLGISHVHAHFGSDATTVALLAARELGGSFSFTAHARDIWHTYVTPEADAAMRRAKMKAAAFTITVSESNARHLRNLCPEAAPRILRLYNGVDLSAFQPVEQAEQRPGDLIAVGRLVEKKGFADLVDACAILRDQGKEFHLDIVGDGPEWGRLQGQIDTLALGDRVALVGALAQETLVARMAQACAAVLPCIVTSSGDRDGLPTVLLEAMARGLPVVTTTVAGGPEIVDDGGTGLLVQPHNPKVLAAALATLLADPTRARSMGRAGRERAERLFDLTQNAAQLRGLLFNPETAAKSVAA